ncbi:MAG: electron transfer flavoprotein subunit beta/FixA family protein [Syntrophomonadaceae bacterium]|jgi:electron transfer flavoprotein beta subunit|nr:electron transfer flavoprotein subunit beta/FixA family protein [Syntrophomonadaceae bacterium]
MNIIVCVKQTVDLQQVRVRKETREPVFDNVPLTIGNIDKNALEEAVRIREKVGGKVIAVSAGSEQLADTIKEALAMGADEAILVVSPEFEGADSGVAAAALAKAIGRVEDYSLILLGEGSADNYSGQVGPRLAEILGLPQVTYVSSLEVENDTIKAVRNLDDCFENVEVGTPAVVSVVSEINEPRIPSVTQILKAGKKPKEVFKPEDLGIEITRSIDTLSNLAPEQDRKRILFQEGADKDVASLAAALEAEGLVRR